MKAQHTPGPWHTGGKNDLLVFDERGWSVASTGYGFHEIPRKESVKNAHLIAAAPELLEAMEMALEWIDAVPSDTQLPVMPGFDRDYVNNLIARAKGGTE